MLRLLVKEDEAVVRMAERLRGLHVAHRQRRAPTPPRRWWCNAADAPRRRARGRRELRLRSRTAQGRAAAGQVARAERKLAQAPACRAAWCSFSHPLPPAPRGAGASILMKYFGRVVRVDVQPLNQVNQVNQIDSPLAPRKGWFLLESRHGTRGGGGTQVWPPKQRWLQARHGAAVIGLSGDCSVIVSMGRL